MARWRNGNRDRLKICWTQVLGGSSPLLATNFNGLVVKWQTRSLEVRVLRDYRFKSYLAYIFT